jgi:small subunit ribosomal protein S1
LVHISELSWGRIDDPREVYHEGQRVKVKVLNVDHERQRIALSIKALSPDLWDIAPEKYQEGTLIEGKVTQIVDFGIFVELEPGVEGLLHNSELGDVEQRNELGTGDAILVKVIRVEPDRRRIGLSVRQVSRNEWEDWAMAKAEEVQVEAETAEEVDIDDDDDEGEVTQEIKTPAVVTEHEPEVSAAVESDGVEDEGVETVDETETAEVTETIEVVEAVETTETAEATTEAEA